MTASRFFSVRRTRSRPEGAINGAWGNAPASRILGNPRQGDLSKFALLYKSALLAGIVYTTTLREVSNILYTTYHIV